MCGDWFPAIQISCMHLSWRFCVWRQWNLYPRYQETTIWYLSIIHVYSWVFTFSFFFVLVQVRPQCTVNEDCPFSEICQLGNCIDACRATKCGTNAICTSSNHRAECSCVQGFQGDPFTACRPRKQIQIKVSSTIFGKYWWEMHDSMLFFQRPHQLSLAWMWVAPPMMNVLTILHVKTDSV